MLESCKAIDTMSILQQQKISRGRWALAIGQYRVIDSDVIY